mmetsp:Transcript_22607/g.58883  ORF Transcript_22607/g.58883 Transcript_22607/m.58883 type:complete len:231 (-) Transcript_22607:44-736(-)
MKFVHPFMMPRSRVTSSPTKSVFIVWMMGMPPQTAASYPNWTRGAPAPCAAFASATTASISGRQSAMSALLAVTTSLPARSARKTTSLASVVPPMTSTTRSTSSSPSTASRSSVTTHPGGAVQSRALAASRTTTALTSRLEPPVAATSCSRRRSRISTMPPPTVPPPTMPTLRTCAASGAPRADAAAAAGANARPRAHHDATRTPRTIISVDFREGAPRKYGLLCVKLVA